LYRCGSDGIIHPAINTERRRTPVIELTGKINDNEDHEEFDYDPKIRDTTYLRGISKSNPREHSVQTGLTKYRIIERLGAGGMGEVYKAEDLVLRRPVAIKVLAKDAVHTPEASIRFLREARAASAIRHPNIVTIFEVGETSEQAYIVMEYVHGRTLRALISQGTLTCELVLDVSRQICRGLGAAHSVKIIHRDIKPENIILSEHGEVKLLDFGLAKAFEQRQIEAVTLMQSLTESGTVVGTLSYMSPEQLRGEPLDERTDIFSFGIVLYEMITRRLPFSGTNQFEVAAAILKDHPPLGPLPNAFPRGMAQPILRCLEKDREKRYSSFADLDRDLNAISTGSSESTVALEPTVGLESAAGRRERFGWRVKKDGSDDDPPRTVMVLPIEIVNAESESSHIGVGLAHAIRTNLAKIGGFSVLSKTASAGRIGNEGVGAREVARELGATIMLEGEVMNCGKTTEAMLRLTEVETGRVMWGGQYRGESEDLFALQDVVCEGVATALKIDISGELRDRLAHPPTANAVAFDFYSKGRDFVERFDVKPNVDYAIQMFDKALSRDDHFALAQAGLCEAYWRKYQETRDAIWVERAVGAGDHALALDPHQAEVHVSLGVVYAGTGRVDPAILEFERAIEIEPMNNDAYRWLARCYQRKGEILLAIRNFEKAIQLRSGYWENYYRLGICYYIFGMYSDAAEQFRHLISIQPDSYHGYDKLGGINILLGRYEEAVSMHKRAIEVHPNYESYSNLGTAYFYLGRYDDAVSAYQTAVELNPREDVMRRNLGDAYLRLGKEQEAEREFRFAVDLISERLRVEQASAEPLARLAICRAKLGERIEALDSIEQATALEPRNTLVMYLKSVVLTLGGNQDQAIEQLGLALRHGYSSAEARRDPDLESLRSDARYAALFDDPPGDESS
jgi:eukaryotic-like serine/threonine-protein kinase